jgi:hypothetical protein
MGWDMRSGFDAARGNYMIVIDGDGQNPTEDVLHMYHRMKHTGADVMKGLRIARFDGPYRRLLTVAFNFLFRVLYRNHRLYDINGKPKGVTRAAYEQMDLKSDGWFLDAEMVLAADKLDLYIDELPVVFFRNYERPSFVGPSAIWEFVVNVVRFRFRGSS